MTNSFLLPHKFKKLGWILLCLGLLLGVFYQFLEKADIRIINKYFNEDVINFFYLNFSDKKLGLFESGYNDELIALLIIVGGILVGFCKTKVEDEFITNIRTSSLVWSVYLNYAILLIAVLFLYDMAFFDVMVYNMFTVLLFFILRFHILLFKSKKL